MSVSAWGGTLIRKLEGVAGCRQLKALVANNNLISNISALQGLSRAAARLGGVGGGGRGEAQLECLILSHNCITEVPPECLGDLGALKKLSFSHNRLQHPPVVARCERLQELRLAYNNITHVPLGCLPANLEILDLGHNQIHSLQVANRVQICMKIRENAY